MSWASVCPSRSLCFGDGVAELPERVGLSLVRTASTASRDDALLECSAKQPFELGCRRRCPGRPWSLRRARATGARPRSGARVPGMCLSTSCSESCGTSSNPSTALVRASRKRSRSSARVGTFDARPGDRARGDRRHQAQRDGGDDAERALGADQQLVEAVAAIVLLEAGQAVVDRCRRAAPLRRPRPATRIVPNFSTCVPPALVEVRPPIVQLPRAPSVSGKRMPASCAASCRVSSTTPASATASRFSALIERMRFIRRIDRSTADPSAGGVAPAAMPVLPPCGTSGTRCSRRA